jgi:hypothetical protein
VDPNSPGYSIGASTAPTSREPDKPYELRREALALVPDWFSIEDLLERPAEVRGEFV